MDFKESEKLEIKSSFSEWKEAIITLCAFAVGGFCDFSINRKLNYSLTSIQSFAIMLLAKTTRSDFARSTAGF